jgi:hypothetical protein
MMGLQQLHGVSNQTSNRNSNGVLRRAFKAARIVAVCTAVFLLLASILVIRAWAAPITIDAAHFPDVAFRAYVSSNFDANADGILSQEEAEAVEEIELTYRRLASLKGIEHFPNLAVLDCGDAQLTSLDLSKNRALQELDLYRTQLTSLDLSKNTALQVLNIEDIQVPSLDLSKNTALESIIIDGVQLASLDVSNLPELISLELFDTQIPSLIIRGNPALEEIMLDELRSTTIVIENNDMLENLEIDDGEIGTLAIRGCEMLEIVYLDNYRYPVGIASVELIDLPALHSFTSGAPLKSLTLKDLPSLGIISCEGGLLTSLDISDLPALEQLYLEQGLLISLDVSACPNLEYLNCSKNQLTSLIVSDSPKLTEVNCSSNRLTSLDLSTYPALTNLDCRSNLLDSLDISANSNLTNLDCGANLLTSLTVNNKPKLEHLNCDYNLLTSLDVSDTPNLQDLDCGGNYLTSLDVSDNAKLYDLSCYNNQLNFLKAHPGVQQLYCASNRLLDIVGVDSASTWLGWGGRTQNVVVPVHAEGGSYVSDIPYEFFGGHAIKVDNDSTKYDPTTKRFSVSITELDKPLEFETSVPSSSLVGGTVTFTMQPAGLVQPPTGVKIDEINFPDSTFRLAVREQLDEDGNGWLSPEEVADATVIDLYVGCSSLTGIEHLSNLQDLFLGFDNTITSLDLSSNLELKQLLCGDSTLSYLDITKNSKLERLTIVGTSLTSLDLSGCYSLQYFSCSEDRLTSINFGAPGTLEHLEYIHCEYSQLASLDVSGLPALVDLTCPNNQLSSLNLGSAPALQRLACRNNQLTSLNLNPALEELICDGNLLTSLDVSANPALRVLSCSGNFLTSLDVSANPALHELYCQYNQITSLDVSANPALHDLSCDGNQLASLDVSANPALGSLSCARNHLTSLDVSNNPLLSSLGCSNNELLDIIGVPSTCRDIFAYGQVVRIPVLDTPNQYGAYESGTTYDLGTHTIQLGSGPANYDTATQRFTVTQQNAAVAFTTDVASYDPVTGVIIFSGGEQPVFTYTVTFKDWDATSLSEQTVVEGDAAVAPASPVRPGYAFTGWDTDFVNVTKDLVITAQYSPIPYTVTFEPGAHGTSSNQVFENLTYGDSTPTPVIPTAEPDWVFNGWSPSTAAIVTSDAVYVATWTFVPPAPTYYQVIFKDFDGGQLSAQSVIAGSAAVAPQDPTRAGYTFTGWDVPFNNVTSNLIVTAQYTPILYTVTFSPGDHGDFAAVTHSVAFGASTPVSPQTSAKPGWVFNGWSPEIAPTATKDVTYTATWKALPAVSAPGYTVIFLPGEYGDFAPLVHENVAKGDKTPTPPVPQAHQGWLFAGWSPALAQTVTADVTYTATWTEDPAFAPTPPSGPPTQPVPEQPASQPETIIINNPAPQTPANRYITITVPAPDSPRNTATPAPADTQEAPQVETPQVELPNEETPLGSAQTEQEQPQDMTVWLVVSFVLFASVVLIGTLLIVRPPRKKRRR